MEPDFLSQTAEATTPEARREWARREAEHAAANGATHHRWSEDNGLLLYEGWKHPPYVVGADGVRRLEEGEPRFQYVAS